MIIIKEKILREKTVFFIIELNISLNNKVKFSEKMHYRVEFSDLLTNEAFFNQISLYFLGMNLIIKF